MHQLKLHKSEKLCSRTAINTLFAKGDSVIAYPLRAVFRTADDSKRAKAAQFMISIPKKKIHTAVGRVLMRRRVREIYRLNRDLLYPTLEACGKNVDIAFTYLSKSEADYAVIEGKMKEILAKISASIESKP